MDILRVKVELNFAVRGLCGVLSAKTNGLKITLKLFAVLLATVMKVRICS